MQPASGGRWGHLPWPGLAVPPALTASQPPPVPHTSPATGALRRVRCPVGHHQPSQSAHAAALLVRAASRPAPGLCGRASAASPGSFTQLVPSQPLRLPSGSTYPRSPPRTWRRVLVPPPAVLTALCWDRGVCPQGQAINFGFRGDCGRHFQRPALNPAGHRMPKSGISAEK